MGVPIYRDVLLRRASLSTTEPPDCAVFFGGETTTKGGKGQLIGKLQNEDRRSDKVMDKEGNAGTREARGAATRQQPPECRMALISIEECGTPALKLLGELRFSTPPISERSPPHRSSYDVRRNWMFNSETLPDAF